MKKFTLLLLSMALLFGQCKNELSIPHPHDFIITPVYVSFVLHYEENFNQTPHYFLNQRNALRFLAQYLRDEGITLNLQPDWAFMAAMMAFEDEEMRQSTGDKNILRYLKEDLGHEIDPHAHEQENGYNYADVAYLIELQGVTPSNIAGGLIVDPPYNSKYDYLTQPIQASRFNYTWQAQWLWGDATVNHVNDTPASGVWRPKDQDHFYENDDTAPLPCIGKFRNSLEGVYELIQRLEDGRADPGYLYTATVFIGQNNVAEMHRVIEATMLTLRQYESQGKLIFASLGEIQSIWVSDFEGKGYLYIPDDE